MQEHPNLIAAQNLWSAIAESDVLALHALLSEKAVWRMYGDSPLAGSYVGPDEIIQLIARIGDLTVDLQADLIDIFVSDEGAVLRYRVRAARGMQELDIEHLFMIRVDDGRIADAVFAPIDQGRYDRFFTPQ
jgi:ketosteroid isomerase-like protein